jgi:F-type H+-transporting ATPase subunit epsilon
MIHFQLVSSSGTKYDGDAYEVLVPTRDGTIALFEDHMPLISAGAPGVINVRKQPSDADSEMESFAVSGGVVQVDGKTIRFVSDEVDASNEISEAEAEAALKRAQELMAGAQSQVQLNEAKQLLSHSTARLQVAKFKKRRHP